MPGKADYIHPEATGAAARTVAAHQAPTDEVTLYAGWFCPFAARAWLTLEEKGIPYQYKETIPYKEKTAEFLSVSPKGLIPAIKWHGKPLHESMVICEFLEDAYPNTPSLVPTDAYDRAQMKLAYDIVTNDFLPPFVKLLGAQPEEPEKQEKHRQELYTALRKYADNIRGPYYFGEQFTFADIVLAPWASRWYILAKHRGFDFTQVGAKFVKWNEAVVARPAFARIWSEEKHYEDFYGPYLKDEASGQSVKAAKEAK